MKAFLKEILPRIQKHSQRLDNLALLTDHPWVELNETGDRVLYVFRSDNNELLASKNGEVSTCTWEYLEHAGALLIEVDGKRRLYKQGFVDPAVLVLRQDGKDEFLLLANENKIEEPNPKVIQGWLETKYLPSSTASPPEQSPTARPEKPSEASGESHAPAAKAPDQKRGPSILAIIGIIIFLSPLFIALAIGLHMLLS